LHNNASLDSVDDYTEFRADQSSNKERLDVFLTRHIPALSRAKVQKSIAEGCAFVNGEPACKKTGVSDGDIVLFLSKALIDDSASSAIAQNIPLSVLYEDEYIIAVDKPAGMVVHPGNGNRDATLVNALLYYTQALSQGSQPNRPGIVHRLDKDTSGVILVAKNDEIHRILAQGFAERKLQKEYIGLCIGRMPPDHDNIESPLGRSRRDPIRRAIREDGKPAHTEYWHLAFHCGISVVKFAPHTGRTHQIRVHASALGFPVLCDPLYGGGRDAIDLLAVLDRPFAFSIYKCFLRHALHAQKLTFMHPVSQKKVVINAPLPADFISAISLFPEGERLKKL